jgi:zinc transport system ATP-binding protein
MSADWANAVSGSLIEARGIAKRLGGHAVLADVDIAVRPGEIVTVIGPNGAGKTTLLRILLGLMPQDRGDIRRKAGLTIGYMPQRVPLDDIMPLPVRRFLELGRPPRRSAIAAALAEVGAGDLLDAPIQGVSGGEFQRVLLARALLRNPDLLVLDEPAQGVDVAGQDELFALIVALRERHGCGVLMVSHDLHLVMSAADTVVCINHHVCCTGRPEAVSRDPAYLSLFGAHAVGMLAPYTHHHDHAHDVAGQVVTLVDSPPPARNDAVGHRDHPDQDHRHG